jgi:hypothetical protein
VEVESVDDVLAAESRLTQSGLDTTGVDETICCFAEKTETWIDAPDGNRWEWYVKKADADQLVNQVVGHVVDGPEPSACAETGCC